MPRVVVSAVSEDAARAGARVADDGGGAADAAVASALASVVTHPGMCSLGGGAFALVLPPSGDPVAVDGGIAFPGRGADDPSDPGAVHEVRLEYGGGVVTTVGPGSVGTPGLLAALDRVSRDHGRLPWRRLVAPARERVEDGFPLPAACHRFLRHAHAEIYARDPRSRAALHDGEGELLEAGDTVDVPGLADSLEALGREGVDLFYRGELGRRIADHVREEGGALTRRDLAAYRAPRRSPLRSGLDGWTVSTNPLPAVGGALLSALLRLSGGLSPGPWDAGDVSRLARIQRAVEGHRRRALLDATDPAGAVEELLRRAETGDPSALGPPRDRAAGRGSTSTLHVSAVDSEGRACAVTCSDGYGSGVMPPGTGIWLNNCLGERELAPGGPGSRPPGTRLTSNMAPTVGRTDGGGILALGSPGGERIPAIVHQVLLHRIRRGAPLERAVEHPRLLVHPSGSRLRISAEPGLPVESVEGEVRQHDDRDMFFGGVAAAGRGPSGALRAAGDPRRGGGTAVGGSA